MNKFIYTWQSVLTDHQAFTYEALAKQARSEVVPYVVKMEDGVRKIQGWQDSLAVSIKRQLIPSNNFFGFCFSVLRERRDSIHIFAAPFSDIRFIPCILFASSLGIEYYIISEPYSPRPNGYLQDTSLFLGYLRASIRPWLYKLYGLLLRSSVAGIFTISQRSYAQFQAAGFPISKLFRFGYFVPKQLNSDEVSQGAIKYPFDPVIKIIYVGSLIKIKGVDLLSNLSQILWAKSSGISIDIYGPGNSTALSLSTQNIRYRGVIAFGQAQGVMSKYDLVLVPSRYDGWGVVVNEAILAGVPVVCSDEVGAGALVDKFCCGIRFKSEDIFELADKLIQLEKSPDTLRILRENAGKGMELIDPKIAASYMFRVIQAPALEKSYIPSPWYRL